MKNAIGTTLVFGTIAMFVWFSVPRLMSDFWHTREFVPAKNYAITKYECTTWNLFMFNDCTVTFVSLSGESQQITDWRFGPAPSDRAQLMQRGDDVSSVTTDVSLRTVWNRALLALILVGSGIIMGFARMAKTFKVEDASVGAPSMDAPSMDVPSISAPRIEAALKPIGRSTFGKRQA
jgi:hypothetical protein